MNYRNRPVFEFLINWSDPVNKSFSFDLKEVADVGFGKTFFTSLQQDVIQGFEFSLRLLSDTDIVAVDQFTEALCGRLVGFWLPGPIEAAQISAAVSSTQFDIIDQGLSDTWEDAPDAHFYFSFQGMSGAAKITSVEDRGNGLERVTVDQAVSDWESLFTPFAFVQRLHYVRLAEDTEEAKFLSEGQQDRTIRVMELPAEYEAYESGVKKIYLYRFYCSAPMDISWFYTSFAADVISQNNRFVAYPIGHGEYVRGLTLSDEKLEISAQYDVNTPFSLFFPVPMSRPLFVTVLETTLGDPETTKIFFAGRVMSVPDPDDRVKAQCQSFGWLLDQKAPGPYIGPICPWDVYNPKTCKVLRPRYETTATVTAVNPEAIPPAITVSLNFPTDKHKSKDWFAQGFMEAGLGLEYELRMIMSSALVGEDVVLQLNCETKYIDVGDIVQLIPGCDGTDTTCETKFNNRVNFGGFVAVPSKNPSLTSTQSPVSQGGKGK